MSLAEKYVSESSKKFDSGNSLSSGELNVKTVNSVKMKFSFH